LFFSTEHSSLLYADSLPIEADFFLKQNHNIKIVNKFVATAERFKYLGSTVTNQHYILEEIRERLNSGNACYYPLQNLLSSRIISKELINELTDKLHR
jgi:hypothetical protein